jgi:hypothetical protein
MRRITAIAAVLTIACGAVAGAICLDRQHFNIDTETDSLGGFMPTRNASLTGSPVDALPSAWISGHVGCRI